MRVGLSSLRATTRSYFFCAPIHHSIFTFHKRLSSRIPIIVLDFEGRSLRLFWSEDLMRKLVKYRSPEPQHVFWNSPEEKKIGISLWCCGWPLGTEDPANLWSMQDPTHSIYPLICVPHFPSSPTITPMHCNVCSVLPFCLYVFLHYGIVVLSTHIFKFM